MSRTSALASFFVLSFLCLASLHRLNLSRSPGKAGTSAYSRQKAESWIRGSYDETYALLERCPAMTSSNVQSCLRETYEKLNVENSTAVVPWWFRTLLRDSIDAKQALHGPWHQLESVDPPLRICTIEKVGTTQWRKVSCKLNGFRFVGMPCRPSAGVGAAALRTPPDAQKVVFLRDPLERFLSAYLDKCIRLKEEGHCEPNVVFNSAEEDSLMEGVEGNKRAHFEAYVDSMPLKWNVHFFPFGLYCDGLYRTLRTYDFVGNMGRDFYRDLVVLGRRFGDKMTAALEDVFRVSENANVSNVGKETKAPERVGEYYTGRTVRRVLQYHSIDYIKLNLTLPEWALEMLEQDATWR